MRTRRRLSVVPAALALIPLLDMVSLLVQVLLINIHFGSYAEIQATNVQFAGVAPTAVFALTVEIHGDGFEVRWNEPGTARVENLPCLAPCQTVEDFPFARLGTLLGTIKDQHPNEQSAVVRPRADLPFDIVARTMDTARASGGRPLFPMIGLGGGS